MKKLLSIVMTIMMLVTTAYAAEVEIRSDKGVGKILSTKLDDNTVKIDVTIRLLEGKKPLEYEYVTIAMYGPNKPDLSYAQRLINGVTHHAYYMNQIRTGKNGYVDCSFTVPVNTDETCYLYFSGKKVTEGFELEVLLPPPDEQIINPMPAPKPSGGGGGGGGAGGTTPAYSAVVVQSGDTSDKNISFSDITQSHWAYADCVKLYKLGIVSGYEDETLRPSNYVSREEIAVVLTKAFNISTVETDFEMDDTSSQWAKKYIAAAVENGIMVKDANGTYRGVSNATRAEVVTMINRCLKFDSNSDVIVSFDDRLEVPNYSVAGFSGLIERGIVNGYEDNTLRPNDKITRAELFKIISRVLEV